MRQAVKLFAHLYHLNAEPINVPVSLTCVPSVGEFLFVDLDDELRERMGISDGSGDQRVFEVTSVDHIDLKPDLNYEAELYARYLTVLDHGRGSDAKARALQPADSH